jgi:hypothetical protein
VTGGKVRAATAAFAALVLLPACSPDAGRLDGSATESPAQPDLPPGVLWDGGFDEGGIPEGRNGPDCDTGTPGDGPPAYASVEQMGNSECTNEVELTDEPTRTPDSERALKVTMAPGQQREQLQSTYSWTPDDQGSVDQWYGFSLYYADDWNLGGGLDEEVSAEAWHNPVAWRTEGDNGSLNLSGDMDLDNDTGEPFEEFDTPHMVLRRNTTLGDEGFYDDGLGLDKLDLGPIVTGEWMDFVCHIRWSTTETDALRECWRDGVHMGERTSLNAVDTGEHRLRVGQYQTTAIDHERTTYVDNVRIGTSYEAVDPARTRD